MVPCDVLEPEIKDLRSGDGLGCPSPERKYRDRDVRLTERRGRADGAHKETPPPAGRVLYAAHGPR